MNKLLLLLGFSKQPDATIWPPTNPVFKIDVIVAEVFRTLITKKDGNGISALACVNSYTNAIAHTIFPCKAPDLIAMWHPHLSIIDAEMMEVQVGDEPAFNVIAVCKSVCLMAPRIAGDQGVTLLTMPKGLTFQQLKQIAEAEGMVVDDVIDSEGTHAFEGQENVAIKHTYRVLLSNSFLIDSLNKSFNDQQKLAREIGCVPPTILEYFALTVYTFKIFKKYLYESISVRSITFQIDSDGVSCTGMVPSPYLNFGQFYSPGHIKIDHFGHSYRSDSGIGMGIKKVF